LTKFESSQQYDFVKMIQEKDWDQGKKNKYYRVAVEQLQGVRQL